jgi:hypothetical protein
MNADETPRRIQRRRVKGWKMPPNTVSVTRPGKWGNPYRVTERQTLEWVLREFRCHADVMRNEIMAELRGKNLACFCRLCPRHREGKPLNEACADCAPCHVDPLGEIANDFGPARHAG